MAEVFELLTVALLPSASPRLVRELRERGALCDVLVRPAEHADRLSEAALRLLQSGEGRRRADAELVEARRRGFEIVGLDDALYPSALKATFDPPPVLYVKGKLASEVVASVAIVGSRAASPQGRALARALASDLAVSGVEIVSGLARGIDAEAHRGALDAPGRTVAVLGSALDRIYPREHAGLADAIAEHGGAVVSEFPLGTAPEKFHFPRRNRVIAGLAQAVLVVEAAQKSGALSTARFALDEGREVLAVPGHPSEPLAEGTNSLLRDGATLVRTAADVAESLGLVMRVTQAEGTSGDDILDSLRRDRPTSLEDLASLSGRPVSELLSRLSLLEMNARIRRLPGPAFVRS
ncbi:MAG TPA: DNA-processing protein DprA [Vicinamibacteria bacterium]|nr:DNA-processing protein DprA [Vicinamibacteria bacterium]